MNIDLIKEANTVEANGVCFIVDAFVKDEEGNIVKIIKLRDLPPSCIEDILKLIKLKQ